jgi:hypothetical protein
VPKIDDRVKYFYPGVPPTGFKGFLQDEKTTHMASLSGCRLTYEKDISRSAASSYNLARLDIAATRGGVATFHQQVS